MDMNFFTSVETKIFYFKQNVELLMEIWVMWKKKEEKKTVSWDKSLGRVSGLGNHFLENSTIQDLTCRDQQTHYGET